MPEAISTDPSPGRQEDHRGSSSVPAQPLKRTPLYDVHAALGAKIVPFAGFEMPVQYPTGITAEHKAVREKAGLFDVSHMGEFMIRGPQAVGFVSYVTTNDVAALKPGEAHPDRARGRALVYRGPARLAADRQASLLASLFDQDISLAIEDGIDTFVFRDGQIPVQTICYTLLHKG